MLGTLLAKVIGTQNERELKRLRPLVEQVNAFEPALTGALGRAASRQDGRIPRTAGQGRDARRPACRRPSPSSARPDGGSLNMRHFDVQLIGGAVLHSGAIAEMKTGEGKTLVATLPAYLNALEGKGVHVVTINDYLARRDSEWMGKIYRFLGHDGRRHPARAERRRAPEGLRGRHHLRHEQRVRLRLPARQHEVRAVAVRPARPPLRHRGRSRQHPHRRGANAADYFRAGRGVDRPLLRSRSHHSAPEGRREDQGRHQGRGTRGARSDRRLHRRRKAQDGHADRKRHGRRPRNISRTASTAATCTTWRTRTSSTMSNRRCARTRSSSSTSTT